MGLRETLADLIAAGEKERQRREDAPQKRLAWLKEIDDLYVWSKTIFRSTRPFATGQNRTSSVRINSAADMRLTSC
jgi:hypothetical protein